MARQTAQPVVQFQITPGDAADNVGIQHAAELARMLVRHLGVEGAARTCRENHWDGVLSEVMSQARAAATA